MSFKLNSLAAGIALALAAAGANAASLEDVFSVRGYGTLGVVHSDEDQADFTNNLFAQPEGAGASDQFSLDVDSRFGVQLDINITPRLSGVVQLVSEAADNNSWNGDANKAYQPSLEWANLSYRLTDNLTVRGGRIVLPLQAVSEYRKVGYANHWLRPPVEIYGQVPFNSSDGSDISYRSKIGKVTNTARVQYGVQSVRTTFKAQADTWSISDTVEIGALTLRAAYMNIRFKTTGDGFAPLINPFIAATGSLPGGIGSNAAAQASRILNQYDPAREQDAQLIDLAATYDPGQWFVMAEVLQRNTDGILLASTSGYISGGYRWKQFTPYATWSVIDTDPRNDPGITLAGLPPQLRGLGGVINGQIVNRFSNALTSQQTLAFGVRWDIGGKFALKGQYDYIDLTDGSPGLLTHLQPGFVPGGSLNLISIAVDYVF